jgi:hypothetical protein
LLAVLGQPRLAGLEVKAPSITHLMVRHTGPHEPVDRRRRHGEEPRAALFMVHVSAPTV